MDLSRRNEKAIGVFVSGIEGKQLGWISKETISEVERMGQMDLKITLITFKEKEISFHFSKIDWDWLQVIKIAIVIRQLLRFVY